MSNDLAVAKRCAWPDERYVDLRIRQSGLVQLEEAGTFWLWAWPDLLGWPTGITWLFSPGTGRDRWPGDLWGIDDSGELVIVETKRSTEPADPFEDFLRLEHRRSSGEFIPPKLADIRAHWESLLRGERQFLELHREALHAGTGKLGLWPGVVPYSSKRIVVWRWRTLYLERVAPIVTSSSYESAVTAALQRWDNRSMWSPHYVGLFTVLNSAPPRFSAVGKACHDQLVAITSPAQVHARAIDCRIVSATQVGIECWHLSPD